MLNVTQQYVHSNIKWEDGHKITVESRIQAIDNYILTINALEENSKKLCFPIFGLLYLGGLQLCPA